MEKTLKELLDNYHLIPKDAIDFQDNIYCSNETFEEILQDLSVNSAYDDEYNTNHICLVPRRIDKKLSYATVQEIKNDTRSYRQLAKVFKLSLSTISKIKTGKY